MFATVLTIANSAVGQGQLPPVPPLPQPAKPVLTVDLPTSSQVFPDGGFPTFPAKPEGGIPAADAVEPPPGPLDLLLAPPNTDYGPGYYPGMFQDAPGALEPRPNSYLTPGFYNQPGYNAGSDFAHQLRTIEIYAPAGYEARDQQVTPGTPEFILLTPPAPVTQEERDRFVVRGLVPGSFLVPGTNTSFRMRGFVRLMGFYDFDPIGKRRLLRAQHDPGAAGSRRERQHERANVAHRI